MAFHQTQSTADASASIHMDALDPFVHELAASHEELLSHLEPLCQPHFKAAAFSPTSVEPHQLHSFAEQHMQTPWHYTGNLLMTRSQSADAFLISGGVAGLSASSSQTPSTSPELTYNAGDDEDDEDDDASDDDILEGTYIDPRNSRTASAAVAGKKATKRKYKRRAPLNQRFQSLPVPPTACGSVSVERASSIGPGSGSNGGGTKPRNYLCTHPGCGQEFLSSGHLVRHLRIHTQERPFKCSLPHCDMARFRPF
ncbi:hypothetical protein BC830DRAFT_211269 [Chytriomyces sp. MP71]|nr:hypothetical protein BC830DRAFT_211269 [Chytriomyces sp. MP71]